jgi:hypothetical protein
MERNAGRDATEIAVQGGKGSHSSVTAYVSRRETSAVIIVMMNSGVLTV